MRDKHLYHGALAQLGERYAGSVEVIGSIPLCSTYPNPLRSKGFFKDKKVKSLYLVLVFSPCALGPEVICR